MNEEEKQAYNYLEKYIEWETLGERNLEGDIKTILNLIKKQQEEIEARLEEIDSLYKMISTKDDKIEQMKEAYQTLKDDIEGHRIAYVDTPEFEENYISKDKIEKLKDELKELQHFKEEVIDIIKYADDTAEPTYWNIRKLLGLGDDD